MSTNATATAPAVTPKDSRLLSPEQATIAIRLHRLGIFDTEDIARVLDVPQDRLARSFRQPVAASDG